MKKLKLLPWVVFHHDLNLMVARPIGIVNEAHVNKTLAMVEEAEKQSEKPFNRYIDLSKVDAIDLSFKYIFRISLYRRLVYAKYPPVKSAMYVTSPAAARVAKLHVMLTDHSPLKVRMFKERAAAAKWLGVSLETLEMGA